MFTICQWPSDVQCCWQCYCRVRSGETSWWQMHWLCCAVTLHSCCVCLFVYLLRMIYVVLLHCMIYVDKPPTYHHMATKWDAEKPVSGNCTGIDSGAVLNRILSSIQWSTNWILSGSSNIVAWRPNPRTLLNCLVFTLSKSQSNASDVDNTNAVAQLQLHSWTG